MTHRTFKLETNTLQPGCNVSGNLYVCMWQGKSLKTDSWFTETTSMTEMLRKLREEVHLLKESDKEMYLGHGRQDMVNI